MAAPPDGGSAALADCLHRLRECAAPGDAALALVALLRRLGPQSRAGAFVRTRRGWRAVGGDLSRRGGKAYAIGPAGDGWAELRVVGPLPEPTDAILGAAAAVATRLCAVEPGPDGGVAMAADAASGAPTGRMLLPGRIAVARAVARAVALASDFAGSLRGMADALATLYGASRVAVFWSVAGARESAVVGGGGARALQRWAPRAMEVLDAASDGVHQVGGTGRGGVGPAVLWCRSRKDAWHVRIALGFPSSRQAAQAAADLRRTWGAADGLIGELLEHAWRTDWARERAEWQHRVDRLAAARRLAADAAHEIRNPLAASRGYLQLIGRRSDDQAVRRYVAAATGEIDRIDRIVRDFLLFARPAEPESERLRVIEVLADVADALSAEGDAQGVAVEMDSPAELPPIYGVAERLRQMFMNLGRNALQAMPHGGRLRIAAVPADGDRSVVVRFRDSGPGIPAEISDRIFEAFVTGRPDGTGLGLAVCQAIAREHAGTITGGNPPGGGAEFVVTLAADRRGEGTAPSR